jgi:PAS domain-containing protein
MDEVLRESEQRHRILFEEALNPIFLVDENGLYVDANEAALQFMECEREKLMGRSVWDFAPPAIIDRQKQEHSPFSKKRMLETDYLIEGKIKTLLNVVLNVERKQAEGELLESLWKPEGAKFSAESDRISPSASMLKSNYENPRNNFEIFMMRLR